MSERRPWLQLMMELSERGVTQVWLKQRALDEISQELKGLYQPTRFIEAGCANTIEVGWRGTIAGVEYFKDLGYDE